MKTLHKTPKGYRRLKVGEKLRAGDLGNFKGNDGIGIKSGGFVPVEELPASKPGKIISAGEVLAFYRKKSKKTK